MFQKVRKSFLQSLQVLLVQVSLRNAAVVFQSTNSSYDNNCAGFQTCHTAFDIQEFLCTKVCTETSLCDGIVSKTKSHLRSGYGVTAVCDICEGTAVYDCRYMLQSLNQVRFQSVFQKSCHSALCVQVCCGNRFLLRRFSICISNDNSSKSFFQVRNVLCKAENSHDLGCNGDIVAILSRHAICSSAKTIYYVTKLTVVHIYASSPGDLSRINVQSVALENVVVDHCCQQVVCRADRMEITGEVKVDIFHRNNLCISAACCSAFYSEYRSEGRLTKSYHYFLAKLLHSICQTYGSSGFSFSCGCRVDSGNQDQLAILALCLS